MRGANAALLRGFAKRRHHHGIKIERNFLELDIDDVGYAYSPFGGRVAKQAELQHLPKVDAQGKVAVVIGRCAVGGTFHKD